MVCQYLVPDHQASRSNPALRVPAGLCLPQPASLQSVGKLLSLREGCNLLCGAYCRLNASWVDQAFGCYESSCDHTVVCYKVL